MFRFSYTIILLIACTQLAHSQTNEVYMIGPMLHFNFGEEKHRVSFGIEVSYWNYEKFPYSFDGCIEFEKQKIRLYSEVQTGIGLAGISCGPLIEFRTKEKMVKGGFQASIWANYFLGFDLRYRLTGNTSYICPGTYIKIPAGIFGGDYDSDGNSDFDFDWD